VLEETPGTGLVVANETAAPVTVFLDDDRLGDVAAGETRTFDPGRSAPPKNTLRATAAAAEWTLPLDGPPWGRTWRLR
jgi:hypothetical protein